jgi:hypothetical protein
MGIVMINCPETRRAISTGIQVDRATFHSTPVFFSRTLCPHCGKEHEWFAKKCMGLRFRPCELRPEFRNASCLAGMAGATRKVLCTRMRL